MSDMDELEKLIAGLSGGRYWEVYDRDLMEELTKLDNEHLTLLAQAITVFVARRLLEKV